MNLYVLKGVGAESRGAKLYYEIWTKLMKQHLSIACFRNDGCDDLIGVNVFTVVGKNDPKADIFVS